MLIDFKQLKIKEVLTFISFPIIFYAFPRQVVKFFQFCKNLVSRPPITEPDLAARPSWANYLAQSVNGYWKWYKEEPVLNKFGFWVNSSKQEVVGYTPLLENYTTYINLKELFPPMEEVQPQASTEVKKTKSTKKK